jgi:hypothetical protein
MEGNQDFTDLYSPDPHGALDRRRWKQRRIGINSDRKLAVSHLRQITCKRIKILGVKIVSRIRGRKIPCDLCGSGDARQYWKNRQRNHHSDGHSSASRYAHATNIKAAEIILPHSRARDS